MILKKQNKPISIIQSRTNTHIRLSNSIKNIVPKSYFKKYKIGLLTCVTNNMYYKRYKKALEIKKNYCRHHNYSCLIYKINENDYEHKNGWIKIYKLLELLNNYDYIFCSDADVIITNRDIRIEDIIFKYMREKHNMLITTDFNSINSGNIIWAIAFPEDSIDFPHKKLSEMELDTCFSGYCLSFFNNSFGEPGTIHLDSNYNFLYMCLKPF